MIKKTNLIKNFYLKSLKKKLLIKTGDIIEIIYSMSINNKEYLKNIQGLIISIKNNLNNTKFCIQRKIDNIYIQQNFFFNSLKIISIKKISSLKVNKSKLFFIKNKKNNYKKLK
jgi:ribosomal protein L19